MLGRRFLILVAVLMGLTALAASVAPRQQVQRDDRAEATPTPSAAGSPTIATVEKTLTTSGDTRVRVREGDLVELTVTGPERDSVSVLGRLDAIDPTTPARFSLLAGEPGEYPIELVAADRRIGTLVVR
jgi:hypothetical protein